MIARATLALMLAGPPLASGLALGTSTASASALPRKGIAHPGHRERSSIVAQQRSRGQVQTASQRSLRGDEPPAIVASLDDGLAYGTPRDAAGRPIRDQDHAPIAWQVGTASWYGGAQWQGHRMSDGTRYQQDKLTAAHASLPLGSLVRVSLLDDSRSVVVRITDRPGTHKRIIDLSRGAAAQLGMLGEGIARVKVDPL